MGQWRICFINMTELLKREINNQGTAKMNFNGKMHLQKPVSVCVAYQYTAVGLF